MEAIFILLAVGFLIVLALRKYQPENPKLSKSISKPNDSKPRIRLSDEQIVCLSKASSGHPVYGETPKFKFSQMPDGSFAYDLRTINSLVKRGYLQTDGRGGYVKTDSTDHAIRSATGF